MRVSADVPSSQAKRALRRRLLEARAARPSGRDDAQALGDIALTLPELERAHTCAAYVAQPGEPPTAALCAGLSARGARILLPVLLPDDDLDWAEAPPEAELTPGRRGLAEPPGPRLGREAIGTAAVVFVPALAVDRDGFRLGRGGGSYDRALARVPPGALVVALLWDEELLPAVPVEPHDRPVHAVVTPGGVRRFRTGP